MQFNHRMFAYLLVVLISLFALLVYRSGAGGQVRPAVITLMLALAVQVVLG